MSHVQKASQQNLNLPELKSLCEVSFKFCDSLGCQLIDMQQCRTALLFVFQKLADDIPKPKSDSWFVQVFNKFDRDHDGLIHFEDFFDIVVQYYTHHKSRISHRKIRVARSQTYSVDTPDTSESRSRPEEETRNVSVRDNVAFPQYNGRLAIFDDYDFFDKAGQGSFGKVLVVRHKSTRQVRACKALSVNSQMHLGLIRTEIDLLKNLDHPNILRLFETYHDGSNMYLILELCEGGALFDRILYHYEKLRAPMTEGQVAMYMQQLLSGLAFCHRLGVVHRDIKPENVLFVNRQRDSPLKIIDFGLACTLDSLAKTRREIKVPRRGCMGFLSRVLPALPNGKHVIARHQRKWQLQRAGTPHYMSPEMLDGDYDQMTDVFSVGIVLYQLLTGIHPFHTPGIDDEVAVKARIAAGEVHFSSDRWSHVTAEAKDLTRSLLHSNPRKRLSASDALRHSWFQDPLKPVLHGHKSQLTVSVFEGLRLYRRHGKLKRIVLKLLARELNEFQIQDMRKKFMALDRGGDGFITIDELSRGVRELGIHVHDDDLADLINTIGSSKGQIGYNEFVAALSERRIKFEKSQLREIFKRLDVHNQGKLTLESLKEVLQREGVLGEESNDGMLSEAELLEIFGEASLSVPDGLGFDDFCEIVTGIH